MGTIYIPLESHISSNNKLQLSADLTNGSGDIMMHQHSDSNTGSLLQDIDNFKKHNDAILVKAKEDLSKYKLGCQKIDFDLLEMRKR